MTRSHLCASVLALSLLGCAPRISRVSVESRVHVEIRIAPPPDELPFNPRAERLLAANRQLSSLLGHGLLFDIDAALASEWKGDFERQLIEAIEGLLRVLTYLQKEDSSEFARTIKFLARVECRYSVLVKYAKGTFKGDSLLIEQPAHPHGLIDETAVLDAFNERNLDWFDTHFAQVEPNNVAASEAADYFHWLSVYGSGHQWEKRHPAKRNRDRAEKIANDPEGDVILRVVRLYAHIEHENPALAAKVRGWLLSRINGLTRLYGINSELLPSIASNTPMRRGERALCGWLERELPRATPEERLHALDSLYPRNAPLVCPNIDRFEFGLREADAWLNAGKPSEGGESAQAKLMDRVVCPSVRDTERNPVRSLGCSSGWLRFALSDDTSRRRLASALDARVPELTEQLYASLKYDTTDGPVALVRLLNPQKPAFSAALAAFAESWGQQLPRGANDMLAELWRDRPDRRGDVLYVFARTKSDYFWGSFKTEYGPIGATDLTRFLDHGLPAFEHILSIWPALDRGVPTAQSIVNRLAALLPDASQPSASRALRTLSGTVSRLCEARLNGELAVLHAALEARAMAHANERTALTVLLRDTAAGGCAARKQKNSSDD